MNLMHHRRDGLVPSLSLAASLALGVVLSLLACSVPTYKMPPVQTLRVSHPGGAPVPCANLLEHAVAVLNQNEWFIEDQKDQWQGESDGWEVIAHRGVNLDTVAVKVECIKGLVRVPIRLFRGAPSEPVVTSVKELDDALRETLDAHYRTQVIVPPAHIFASEAANAL